MPNLRHLRLADALAAASPGRRRRIARAVRVSSREPDDLLGPLADHDDVRRREARLGDRERDLLDDLLALAGSPLEGLEELGDVNVLLDAGLAFEMPGDIVLVGVPIEIAAALHGPDRDPLLPLAAWLSLRDEDDLADLIALHNISATADDAVDAAIAIAEAILEPERTQSLFDSLPSPARNALVWAAQFDGPFDAEQLRRRAAELAARFGDQASSAERVLLRIGLLQPVPGDAERYVIAADVHEVLFPILDASLADRCAERYDQLRDGAIQAFRDLFPRGAGGDALRTFRSRMLRALADEPDVHHPVDRLLITLRMLEPGDVDVGRLASFHLDVPGPEPLARQAARAWIASLDDEFTGRLVSAFGGDSGAIARWAHEHGDEPDAIRLLDTWAMLLLLLRAHLLFTLSVLPAGHWFRFTDLAAWYVALWRRVTWIHGRLDAWRADADFPLDALPRGAVDVTDADEEAVADALAHVAWGLLGPLGAVDMDDSGTLFMVNPEALRVFREGDVGFDALWVDAEGHLGDDIDLWLPWPADPGARICGVAGMRWTPDGDLLVERRAHLHDLVRLVQFADPSEDGLAWTFRFTQDSVARAEEWGVDLDEFLVWLTIRTGDRVPGAVRALFPISNTAADGEPAGTLEAARASIMGELEVLESWADRPPGGVVETLRGWGPAAVLPLLERLEAWVGDENWTDPTLPHVILLLGELGDPAAVPPLLRTLAYSGDVALEGASAVACARIGAAVVDPLTALLGNVAAPVEARVAAASALSSTAALHPHLCDTIAGHLSGALDDDELDADIATLLAVHIAETGHPEAETELYRVRERGAWDESIMRFDEAVWLAGLSPAVWGHPWYAAPLAMLYVAADSDELRGWLGDDEPDLSDDEVALALGSDARRRRRRQD